VGEQIRRGPQNRPECQHFSEKTKDKERHSKQGVTSRLQCGFTSLMEEKGKPTDACRNSARTAHVLMVRG